MTVSTKTSTYPCGCVRNLTQIIKREDGKGTNAVAVVVYSAKYGDHDPRREHALRVQVRAWATDTWPGRA